MSEKDCHMGQDPSKVINAGTVVVNVADPVVDKKNFADETMAMNIVKYLDHITNVHKEELGNKLAQLRTRVNQLQNEAYDAQRKYEDGKRLLERLHRIYSAI